MLHISAYTPCYQTCYQKVHYAELIAQSLKVHIDNEFQLLAALGHDLPGALIANSIRSRRNSRWNKI